MKLSEAKIRFDAGELTEAIIGESSVDGSYMLLFEKNFNYKDVSFVERARGNVAYYKTIDAAVQAAKEVGFRKITINIQ